MAGQGRAKAVDVSYLEFVLHDSCSAGDRAGGMAGQGRAMLSVFPTWSSFCTTHVQLETEQVEWLARAGPRLSMFPTWCSFCTTLATRRRGIVPLQHNPWSMVLRQFWFLADLVPVSQAGDKHRDEL